MPKNDWRLNLNGKKVHGLKAPVFIRWRGEVRLAISSTTFISCHPLHSILSGLISFGGFFLDLIHLPASSMSLSPFGKDEESKVESSQDNVNFLGQWFLTFFAPWTAKNQINFYRPQKSPWILAYKRGLNVNNILLLWSSWTPSTTVHVPPVKNLCFRGYHNILFSNEHQKRYYFFVKRVYLSLGLSLPKHTIFCRPRSSRGTRALLANANKSQQVSYST